MVHMHPGDISSERDNTNWSERHLCLSRALSPDRANVYARVNWPLKQTAVLTVPSKLHRGMHQPFEVGRPSPLNRHLTFVRLLLHTPGEQTRSHHLE